MLKTFMLTLSSLLLISSANAASPADTLLLELSSGGTATIELLPDRAPEHVERVKELTREGFYDGIIFHRVIDGFMAQTGDPTGTGMGGSDKPDLKDSFTNYVYKRGTVGAASSGPNTANSQFFICFNDNGCRDLTGKYTVWGQVIDGMEYVDAIKKGVPAKNPDKIVKATILADTLKAETPAKVEAPAEKESAQDAVEETQAPEAPSEKMEEETAPVANH
ncbi:MAG: peptidylprolyl isomerase [Alphaproteobacteria bacterium]|nr:peptidylprolyl isomerase [Alphaproteobacteria bacterium]